MVVHIGPELESVLREQANRQGLSPEDFALRLLRERLLASAVPEPRDEWERGLLEAARPWGFTLPDSAMSREEMYD